MERIACLPHSGPAVLPMARPSNVRVALVREKHIGAAIKALRAPLQPPCASGHRRQVGIVSDHHEEIDVFRIRLIRNNRSKDGNAPNARDLADGYDESAQAVEKLLTVTLGRGSHHVRFNRAQESRSTVPTLRSNEPDLVFV